MGALKTTLKQLQKAELTPKQQEKLGVLAAKNPEFGRAARFMLPGEVASSLHGQNPDKIVAMLRSMPGLSAAAAAAKTGAAKRLWYRASADAVHDAFGDDAPRFTALLAAMSPQTSVETNLVHTLKIWNNWVEAGRPQDPKIISRIMGASVQGTKGEDSVLEAWRQNGTRALTAQIPIGDRTYRTPMKGSKVNSFTANLLGDVMEVTNDAWQSKLLFGHGRQISDEYAKLGLKLPDRGPDWTPQSVFSNGVDPREGDIPKSPGYNAANAYTRMVSDRVGLSPEATQAALWTTAKQLTEGAERTGLKERAFLDKGLLSPELLSESSDFGTMLRDPKYHGILTGNSPEIQRAREVSAAFPPAAIGQQMPLTTADENGLLSIAKYLERARGVTKAAAPVAAAGALSAAALAPEDAEAGLTARLPKYLGEAEVRRWANAREDAAHALAKGEDLDKVFKETGWAPDYNSGAPVQWDVQRGQLARTQEMMGGRGSLASSIEPLLVREFDTFGSKVPTSADVPAFTADWLTGGIAQDIAMRGAPKRGPNSATNRYRDQLHARPLAELLGKDAGLFREYPEMLKANYTGQGGIGAAVYHADSKDPAKMLLTFGQPDPRIIPSWETDPLRSFIEHEGGYHVPQGLDDRMRGRRNFFDYINDPTEVSARAGQTRLHPTVRAMESPRSTMDRYAQAAKGGEHHPQETYPTQGKLFGGAAGTSLAGGATGTGVLAGPTDAEAAPRRAPTSPGILDSALSMLAGGMSPDTAEGQIAEQRNQIYDFIVGAPAQFAGGVVDTGQAVGAGLWQQAAMSDPAFQRRAFRDAGSVFEGEGMLPADRNPIWNAENIPGGTDWNMRKLGANPESAGAVAGMFVGGALTPANWASRVKQAGQYLGDTPWISKIIDKTMDAPVFRKPVKRLDEVNVTDEHVPGAPGHMDDMKHQPENVRNLYSMVGRAQEHRGRNPFYADQQQFGVEKVQGDYTNAAGMREHNPGYRTLLDSTTPEPLLAPRQHLRALVDAQAASAAHRINTNVPPSQVDSVRLDAGPQHGPDVMATVRKNIEDKGLATIDTGNGVTTIRGPFDDSLSPRRVRGILSDIAHSDIGVPRGTLTEGKFESVFETPAWGKGQGTGQAVDNWLASTADADYAGIDTQHLRDYVLGKRQLDDNISPLLGLKQREDIRKMRAMIGNMGIQGFRDFVRKNGSQGLPVVLLGGYLQQNEAPQPALLENGS